MYTNKLRIGDCLRTNVFGFFVSGIESQSHEMSSIFPRNKNIIIIYLFLTLLFILMLLIVFRGHSYSRLFNSQTIYLNQDQYCPVIASDTRALTISLFTSKQRIMFFLFEAGIVGLLLDYSLTGLPSPFMKSL